MPRKKKNPEIYKAIYEPMLNLEIRLYVGEEWKLPYEEILQEVSGHRLSNNDVWNAIIEPIEAEGWGVFRALWVRTKMDYRYLTHEIYHLVNAIRSTYDLCEESWAYLMGWISDELID